MRALWLALLLTSASVQAANIYVVEDGGLLEAYHPQLAGKLLQETCFSVSSDDKRYVPTDFNNTRFRGYYEYRQASLCRNGNSRMEGAGATLVRTEGLPGALGRAGQSDEPVPVTTDSHHSVIADVIKSNTSASVKQWHVMHQFLLGLDNFGNKAYANYNTLKQGTSSANLVRTLEHIADGFFSLNGVKVVNISAHEDNRYEWPCDNHPAVRGDADRVDYMDAINALRGQGVTVVVATANSSLYPNQPGDRDNDNYKMPFPACLSTTVAVGGLSNNGFAQGAISPGTDFLANYHHPHPITGLDKRGTSYATPKVAANLVELLTVNPLLNNNQALAALRNTADFHSGSRFYDNGAVRIDYTIAVPNFTRARNSIVDSFWNDYVVVLLGNVDDSKYGWNYGSSIHENGVLSLFETVNVQEKSESTALAPSQAQMKLNGETSLVQVSSENNQVLRYSFQAYDIDTSDEVEVIVNDKHYGYLKTTGSNQLGTTQAVCISSADLKADGSQNEVQLKLKTPRETWGVTNLKIEAGSIDNECLKDPFPELPNNDDRLAGSSDRFGNAYQREKVSEVPLTFSLESGTDVGPTPTNYNTRSVKRDVRVNFVTRSGNSASTDNGTIVQLNNQTILTTENYFSDEERNYEIVVNRNDLRSGNNTIKFKPRDNTTNSIWGIRAISIEYIEPIQLIVGSQETSTFGYHQSPTRFTGLRANFELTTITNDYGLSVKGWDIDRGDETEVFINGWSVGNLDVSASENFNAGTTLTLPQNRLRIGKNQLEFVQLKPVFGIWWQEEDEQWAVKDVGVSLLKPDLAVSGFTITNRSIRSGVPFSVSTTVQNNGAGRADTSVLRYYISNDDVISTSDTFLFARTVSSLVSGTSITLIDDIETSLINQGYFIGACAAPVTGETNTTNNCSSGVPLRSLMSHLPAILMILTDESE